MVSGAGLAQARHPDRPGFPQLMLILQEKIFSLAHSSRIGAKRSAVLANSRTAWSRPAAHSFSWSGGELQPGLDGRNARGIGNKGCPVLDAHSQV